MSDSLRPHELQHARLPCPSPFPRACSNSCPSSQWCHPTISSSVASFSSCPQSFPASGSFLISHLFTSGGQSIGASASASVPPMNIQGWFPLGLTGLISLLSKWLSRVFSSITVWKHKIFWHSTFFMVQFSHPYMTTGKTIALTVQKSFIWAKLRITTKKTVSQVTQELLQRSVVFSTAFYLVRAKNIKPSQGCIPSGFYWVSTALAPGKGVLWKEDQHSGPSEAFSVYFKHGHSLLLGLPRWY